VDQDIIDLYVHGARDFDVDQAERYYRGPINTFERLLHETQPL
jgi:plasmid stabilization system protein ParE